MTQQCPNCRQTIDTTGLAGMTIECPRCQHRLRAHDKSIPQKPKIIGPSRRPTRLQRLAIQAGLLLTGALIFVATAIYMMNAMKNIKPLRAPPKSSATH